MGTNAMNRGKSWYLIHTKPRQEHIARTHLERQGYTTYLPVVSQARRRSGRRIYKIEPFFPRYLFIYLDTSTDNWAPIRSTKGVSTLVQFGFTPAIVPDDLVAQVKVRENGQGLHEINVSYQKGDRVHILDGPMMGYEGIFQACTGEERIIVLLDVMGKQARLEVDLDAVAQAG